MRAEHSPAPFGLEDAEASWVRAMRAGDFAAAWKVSDAVLAARDPAERDDPRLPYHVRWVWDGRPFRGRHVLVRCYHGLGDTIQFARFLPMLRREAASLTVEVQPELIVLIATVPGPDRLIPFRPYAPFPPAECDLEIMELAHALRIDRRSLPGPISYVRSLPKFGIPPKRTALRIGLCWSSGAWDPARSVSLSALSELGSIPETEFYSLQRGPAANEACAADGPTIINPEDRSPDIMATAGLIESLDLVITVDTMIAHLAGALGAPTWLLLKADADWRWMSGQCDSPWYPRTRLYRQQVPGNWRAVISAISRDLSELVQQRARIA